jgi:hypothetical protein
MSIDLKIPQPQGRRTLLVVTGLLTAALGVGTYGLSLGGGTHGLSPIFFSLFVVGDYAGFECALIIVLAAALVPGRYPTGPLLQWIGRNPGCVAAASAVILSCGAWTVYLNSPLSMDEYAAFFQSQIFAAGHIGGQFPPALLDWLIPRGFQNYFLNVTATGRVTSAYWPSFALILTPFTWLGIPWACNPVISALTILSVHRLALRTFGDLESAGLAVLLTAASPVFFADGISYYSMSAHLLANTLFALLLAAPTSRKAFTAGLIGSVALTLHNPVPHLLFALPWIVSLLRRPGGLRLGLSLFAGYLPLCLVLGLGWFLLTTPSGAGIAHLRSPFSLPTSTVLLMRLVGIAKLWAWAVPGLLVLAAVGAWKWRHDNTCLLLTASALLTLLGYLFVPFDQGHGWGYRYFHSAWIALPLLATAALTRLPADADAPSENFPGRRVFEDGATRLFIVACAIYSLIGGTGLRAAQIHNFVVQHQSQVPAYSGTEPRVVILDTRLTFYGRDLVQNDPWLRENVIVMITHGPAADAEMMRANFPQMHRVYTDRFGSVWSTAVAGRTTVTATP